jgi:hypothetical protein
MVETGDTIIDIPFGTKYLIGNIVPHGDVQLIRDGEIYNVDYGTLTRFMDADDERTLLHKRGNISPPIIYKTA